tara:strand:+ start:254 stop:739 length:486 start_codon:yes stop_codon:yes gene_type:complete
MKFKFDLKRLFLFVFVSLFVIACDDDNDSAEEHIDAEGFILENENGNEIYRYFKGDVTGSLSLDVDEEMELAIHFLDDDEEEIEHDDEHEDEEAFLSFSEYDSDIILIEQVDDHDHDHDHGMEIRIVGISSGFTSFKLELMHGDHADYETIDETPIQITVN